MAAAETGDIGYVDEIDVECDNVAPGRFKGELITGDVTRADDVTGEGGGGELANPIWLNRCSSVVL